MRWPTHQAAALGLALLCHLPVPGLVAAVAGGIVPDVLDQKLARLAPGKRLRQKVFNKIHRSTTHWFGWWLALLVLALQAPASLVDMAGPLAPVMRPVALGLALGALSHVLLDMLTPHGVPLLPVTRRLKVAVPLCSTGSWREYLVLAGCVALCVWQLRHDIVAFCVR